MNVGMGVPMRPVARRVATWRLLPPPRNNQGLVRLAGRTGFPQSSVSSGADGPSPRPALPWHLLHSMAPNISFPRAMDSLEVATSFGSAAVFGGYLNAPIAKLFTEVNRFQRSFSASTLQVGMVVHVMPSDMMPDR